MKIAIRIVGSLVGLVGVIAMIGFFLPVDHEASRSAEIPKPPEAVFALLSDVGNYQTWWAGATVKSEVRRRWKNASPPQKKLG